MVDQHLRFDPEELHQPFPELDIKRLAKAKRLTHLFFHLWRYRQRHLCHRVIRRQIQQQENNQADENKRRDRNQQTSDGECKHEATGTFWLMDKAKGKPAMNDGLPDVRRISRSDTSQQCSTARSPKYSGQRRQASWHVRIHDHD